MRSLPRVAVYLCLAAAACTSSKSSETERVATTPTVGTSANRADVAQRQASKPADAPATEKAPEQPPASPPAPRPVATTPPPEAKADKSEPAAEPPPPPAKPMPARGAASVGPTAGALGKVGARAPARRREEVEGSSEEYQHNDVNKMTLVEEDRLSTFAVDVDTASYSISRRKILEGQQVPPDAVRVEEFLNYFRYGYEGPGDERPFAVHLEAAPSPYSPGRHILRVGVQGRNVAPAQRKPAHLVFLVDVSGSMSSPDKLPLAQRSLRIMVDNLNPRDTVAMVTYAGSTRVVLEPTSMDKKAKIYAAIDELSAGGSTAMGSGIELAYKLAARSLSPDSISRVIVLSDGDANVGNTTHEQILDTIRGKVREGVTLSTIGFGMGNYKDTMMEQLANKGNGNSYYIDGLSQAKRVFQEQLGGMLEVIAQDTKIQVEMNPDAIKTYRLIGYENRDIADRDFRNDKVDAGEIGAGHSVTAVYEIELAQGGHGPLATVRLRAKKPRGVEAAEYEYVMSRDMVKPTFDSASESLRFATAVMGFAEILRNSPYADNWRMATVQAIAKAATPAGNAEREELLELMSRAARSPALARR